MEHIEPYLAVIGAASVLSTTVIVAAAALVTFRDRIPSLRARVDGWRARRRGIEGPDRSFGVWHVLEHTEAGPRHMLVVPEMETLGETADAALDIMRRVSALEKQRRRRRT